jgi:hypothetical protein
MIKYCTQPGRGLHRVWLPLDSQFQKDAPDPAVVKINCPNLSGRAFYVHIHLHIKPEAQLEPQTKTLTYQHRQLHRNHPHQHKLGKVLQWQQQWKISGP